MDVQVDDEAVHGKGTGEARGGDTDRVPKLVIYKVGVQHEPPPAPLLLTNPDPSP